MTSRILTATFLMALAWAAPSFAQQSFDSPDQALQAVIDAADAHDTAKLTSIFGPQGRAILSSGNPEQDKAEQSQFVQLARAKHQIKTDVRDSNRATLSIGDLDWPFPIPLVRAKGKWSFDPSQAKVEMQARRIGTHELDAIEICAGYVEAQHKYASEDREKDGLFKYAGHIMSAPDRQNGLYWEGSGGPLVPRAFADAVWDGSKKGTKPYHGYFFRMLDGQGPHATGGEHNYAVKGTLIGGFALVAWPAQYGVTGIHTFIVNQDGVVYQRDLGSAGSAETLVKRFDPDPSWSRVD